jgi:hypothetical protein
MTEQAEVMTVYEEILEALKNEDFLPWEEGEDAQSYLLRLIGAVSELPNEKWEALSQEAQDWFNTAGEAVNNEEPAPPPPGFGFTKPEQKKGRKKSRSSRKESSENGEKPEKRKEPRKTTPGLPTIRTIRKMIIENPTLSLNDLDEMTKSLGKEYSRKTLDLVRKSTLTMIAVAKETGHWKE